MKKYIYILIALIAVVFTQCIEDEMPKIDTPTNANIKLYINEVISTGAPDWVEFYNATDADIDLSGFAVSDGPAVKYTLPSGTTIPAKGYYQFMCDKAVTGFSLSSSGEEFYIWDTNKNIIDQISFGALEDGISYGRTVDGGDTWSTMAPTPGTANSTGNNPPNLSVDTIASLNDNQVYTLNISASDASGMRDVKVFIQTGNEVSINEAAPVGNGKYKYNIPAYTAGTEVTYYVVATDETGLKTYFPKSAPSESLSVVVEDGMPMISEVNFSTQNPAANEDITVTLNAYDVSGIDAGDVRLYYILNDQVIDTKTKVTMTANQSTYSATIPGQPIGTVIRYYFRVEDANKNKTYYPTEGESFDHDDIATWPTLTVAPITILEALVINEIQGDGDPDYIELYNGTSADIDLSGYKLHDSKPEEAYTIPNGTVISAKGFYVLDCSGAGATETLFKISSKGEDIFLKDASDNVVDKLLKTNWPEGHTALVGRVNDGAENWTVLSTASKGTTNNN
ncbi:MAG: lamin tail domain-containing protein [Bacteroidales bacterium]|nr:lamin tail domain-containing protein [Bacteroidales bacterium]